MESSFGTSSDARRKRVFYADDSIIYEGMPLCYDFDTTDNILGYDKGAGGDVACQTTPETTAEGNQNEGKFIQVVDPTASNLTHFAGVVAGTSYSGMTGPRWLDIYIPNGAIVPVRCDVDTTTGLTILAVTSASQELGFLVADSRPVAIAMETETGLDGTTGITLAKLDPNLFSFNYGASSSAYAETPGDYPVNYQYVEFKADAAELSFLQDNRLLYDADMESGQVSVLNNYLHFTGTNDSSGASYIRGAINLVHLDGCTLNSSNLIIAGCMAQLGGTPAAFTACSKATALWVDIGTLNPTSGRLSMIYVSENGTSYADTVFDFYIPRTDYFAMFDVSALSGAHHPIVAMTGDHAFDSNDKALKCDIGGTTYYIPLIDALA